jgi:subtilase family serine protease
VRLKRGLAWSASRTVTCGFSSAESLSGKYLQLVIDPDDKVRESVEINNRVTCGFREE